MDTTINSTLSAIAEKSPQVAQMARAREAAMRAERDAEAAILERAIGLVRPALDAICARILVGSREQAGSTRRSEHRYDREHRGLCLVDGYARDYTFADGGQYYGERLYLLGDASLMEFRREGTWTGKEGGFCEWQVVERRALSPREAMDEYALVECLEPIFAALERSVRSLPDPLQKMQERVEKLRALLVLL